MTEQQRENVEKWIKALRSGDYKQATGGLKRSGGYCCIGVACKIMNLKEDFLNYFFFPKPYNSTGSNILADLKWFEDTFGSEFDQKDLSSMNDSGLFSFNDIADYLESRLKD